MLVLILLREQKQGMWHLEHHYALQPCYTLRWHCASQLSDSGFNNCRYSKAMLQSTHRSGLRILLQDDPAQQGTKQARSRSYLLQILARALLRQQLSHQHPACLSCLTACCRISVVLGSSSSTSPRAPSEAQSAGPTHNSNHNTAAARHCPAAHMAAHSITAHAAHGGLHSRAQPNRPCYNVHGSCSRAIGAAADQPGSSSSIPSGSQNQCTWQSFSQVPPLCSRTTLHVMASLLRPVGSGFMGPQFPILPAALASDSVQQAMVVHLAAVMPYCMQQMQ